MILEVLTTIAIVWGIIFLFGLAVLAIGSFVIWCITGVIWLIKVFRGDYRR